MVELIQSSIVHLATTDVSAASTRIKESWTWYLIRAAGFTAAGLLILLMLSGIGQVTGLTYRFIEPLKAWVIHKALAIALCIAIAIHVLFLLVDAYLPFTLTQVLVPFVSRYSNGSSLFSFKLGFIAVALGVFAMYGVALVVATSLGWIDSKKRLWRKTHYVSYFIIIAVFIHALGTGSDLKYGLFREAWIAVSLILVVAVASRLWRARVVKRIDNHAIDSSSVAEPSTPYSKPLSPKS